MPESLAWVDGCVGDLSKELRLVDETEFVGASCGVLEICGKYGQSECWADIIEECLYLVRRDGIDAAETHTKKTVGLRVPSELGTYGGGELDGLGCDCCSSDVYGVCPTMPCAAAPSP